MTQREFTELTGFVPCSGEWEEIETMYHAVPDMDKKEFCKRWRQCGKNPLVIGLAKQTTHVSNMLEERNDELNACRGRMEELAYFLIGKSCAYDDMDFYGEALSIIGRKEAVLYKVKMGLPLWAEDREYIKKNLK